MHLADMASSGPVALVDVGVLRDMASALTGLWLPATELEQGRAEQLLAAARLRLYGDRNRSGWYLITGRHASDIVLRRGNADWSVGLLPVAENFDDAPPQAEIAALADFYRRHASLTVDAAHTLALAVLLEPVTLVVARQPRAFKHQRVGDLPPRLEVVDPVEAVERLEIEPGEEPPVSLPAGSMLARGAAWWVTA
jgi:hypothetical protein